MHRTRVDDRYEDSHALLNPNEFEDAYDESSMQSSFQEGKPSDDTERSPMHAFDTEDYVPKYVAARKGYLERLLQALNLRRDRTVNASTSTPAQSSKLSTTVRTIFNYPEPGLKLRSTAWLDGLRGLAAFEVFIYHYAREWVNRDPAWGPTKTDGLDPAWYRFPFIRTFYNAGHASVAVFFAISGYVLSHRVLTLCAQQRHEEAYASLSSAIFRRALRLFTPAAIWTFIVMFICWLCDPWLPKPDPYVIEPTLWREIGVWAGKVLDMLLPVNYPDRWTAIMNRYSGNVTWTISLEYYGSLVVYGALLFISRTRSFVVRQSLVYFMVALSFLKDDWIAGQFLLGLAFADRQIHNERIQLSDAAPYAKSSRKFARKAFYYGVFIFGWFLAGLPMVRPKAGKDENDFPVESRPFFDIVGQPLAWIGGYHNRQGDQYLYALAGICLLVGIGETNIKNFMEIRFVQYLGKISFGFYLVHVPIRAWLGALDPIYFGVMGLPFIPWDKREENFTLFCVWMLRMGPAILINLIVGGLFERFVDRPLIHFSRRFEQWCLSFGQKPEVLSLPHHQQNEPAEQSPAPILVSGSQI
jgi:peptidoglycan/LPS O-acetylase OafA/YrhL